MAIAQAGTPTSVKTASTTTTPAMDSTGADLIVLAIIGPDGANYVSGADSKSNTWNNPGTLVRNSPAAQRAGMPYVLAPTVGSGHTFTSVQQYFESGIIAAAFSGVASRDQESSSSSNASGTSHATASGAMTPSANNALILSMFAPVQYTSPGTVTPPTGMTPLTNIPNAAFTYQLFLAYEIQTTATARTPTWTTTNSVTSCGITAIFLASGGGGGGGGGKPSIIYLSQ
jgi:hypothetical protein